LVNLIIGALGFGGAEKVCLELSNHLSDEQQVNLYIANLRNLEKFNLDSRVKIIKFNTLRELAFNLKGQKALFFDYTIGVRVLLLNYIYNLKITTIVRLATYSYKIEKISCHAFYLQMDIHQPLFRSFDWKCFCGFFTILGLGN
jgi:hypothetical protein